MRFSANAPEDIKRYIKSFVRNRIRAKKLQMPKTEIFFRGWGARSPVNAVSHRYGFLFSNHDIKCQRNDIDTRGAKNTFRYHLDQTVQ